ncbi:MAG TPA: NYN domain-containing protein [Myxococcota bacterium]|nr:NYN domain-containing protein [Myxococcota bacterium]
MARDRDFPGQFVREAALALVWMAAFVALAAGARTLADARGAPAYAPPPMADPADPGDEPRTWLVDGFNLMHAAVLRGRDRRDWWRAEARGRVLDLVRRLDAPEAEVVVVFDGQRPADEPETPDARPQVVFADSADEWLIRAVRQAADPGRIAVVTADRQLADRARHRGARVIGPRAFRERCEGAA